MRPGPWQARFTVPLGHPSGRGGQVVTAPHTFEANTYGREAAGDWLRAEELRLNAGGASWRTLVEHAEDDRIRAAAETVPTFAEYAAIWLRARKVRGQPLQESTQRGYLIWLGKYLLPAFGEMPLNMITAADVVRWYEGLPHDKGKTVRECYALAKAIMKSATAADGVLPGAVNPFTIDGAGTIGNRYEKEPKSRAGVRDQRVPACVGTALTEHLRTYLTGRDGLLFPGPSGDWLQPTRFRDAAGGWHDVREAVGRPINFHDLRATGATRLAQSGAHVAEVQAFLGDSSSQAAERYVRATQSRMDDLTATAFAGLDFGTSRR